MHDNYQIQLLAPPEYRPTRGFGRSKIDEQVYRQYLDSMQRLRGRVYLSDGAICPWELDDRGRFQMQADEQSWHFLLVDRREDVVGCVRYRVHSPNVTFEKLKISQSALANRAEWRDKVRDAVEEDLCRARKESLFYVEVGGWALTPEWRGTKAALEILVASYALAHLWGGCIGSCTATVRHNSNSMLRRIGGRTMQVAGESLPAYDDPQYGCRMEILRFDYRTPTERFVPLIDQLTAQLANSSVVARAAAPTWQSVPGEAGAEYGTLLRAALAF
jgi:hypothetical protein